MIENKNVPKIVGIDSERISTVENTLEEFVGSDMERESVKNDS
jgi:hypothetical protein